MLVEAQLVSTKKDNKTWCRPCEGYNIVVSIDLEDYVEVDTTIEGELPASDQKWPLGSPITDFALVKGKLFKKKVPVLSE